MKTNYAGLGGMLYSSNHGVWPPHEPKRDSYAEARGILTDYSQTRALIYALEQRDLWRLRYKTKPDSADTVQSYMSTIRYTTPHMNHVGTAAGIILRCATNPIGQPLLPMGRRACELFAGGYKRDNISVRLFEVQVTLLEGEFGIRCAMNFAAMRDMALKRLPGFRDKRNA